MRECDQLCSRVGILADGEFSKVGDTVALKQAATQGCTIIVKMTVEQSVQEGIIKDVNRGVKREFPNSVIAEKREVRLYTSFDRGRKNYFSFAFVWTESPGFFMGRRERRVTMHNLVQYNFVTPGKNALASIRSQSLKMRDSTSYI